jgi:ketosteroid isomerase-like protein
MTRLISCAALVPFAATVGLCQPPVSPAKPHSVEQTVSRFLVAFANRDVPAFTGFIAEDGTMFFPPFAPGAPPLRVQGKTGITRAFAELYAKLGLTKTTGRQIQPQDLLVQQYDSFAVVAFHLGSDATRGRRSFVFGERGRNGR